MRKALRNASLALLLAICLAAPAWALDGPSMVERGQWLYQQARFQEAQDELRGAIARLDLSPRVRAQAWTYLGFCFLGLGHAEMALEALVGARAADPAYVPDSVELSPKLRELWELSDPNRPARSTLVPLPAPAPAPAIRETPLAQPAPRLYGLELAYDVRQERPVGATRVFAPQTKRIVLWVGLENVAPATPLRAVWTYLAEPQVQITQTDLAAPVEAKWAEFSCQLAPGQTWPAGRYQVEVFLDQDPAGSLEFEVP